MARPEAPVVTDIDFSADLAGYGEELILSVWWDPDADDGGIERASLRSRDGDDEAEALPLALLWLMVGRDDLLEALGEAWAAQEEQEP